MSNKAMKWLPVIDEERCIGCNRCVVACGPKSLEIVGFVAVLVRANTCGSEEHCIGPCQSDAIRMAWVETDGNQSRGKWRAAHSA